MGTEHYPRIPAPRRPPVPRYDPAPLAWARIARRMSDLSGCDVTWSSPYGFRANLGSRRVGPWGLSQMKAFLGVGSIAP